VPVGKAVTVSVVERVFDAGTNVTVAARVTTGATNTAMSTRASRYRIRPLPSPTRKSL
jgi:hypothetical protein